MGLFDFITKPINALTGAVGIQLFPGRQENRPGNQAYANAELLKNYGQSLLGKGANAPYGLGPTGEPYGPNYKGPIGGGLTFSDSNILPDPNSNMGFMKYVQPLIQQQAQSLGMRDPFNMGYDPTYAKLQGEQDPYSLIGPQNEEFNNRASQIGRASKTALSSAKANLAKRGMLDSTTEAAVENAIKQKASGMAQTEHSNMSNQAFAERQATLQNWMQQMMQVYQAQEQQAQQGLNAISGSTDTFQQQAAQTSAAQAATNNFWSGIIGHVAGGGSVFGWTPFPNKKKPT